MTLIRMKEVSLIIGLHKVTILQKMREGNFPTYKAEAGHAYLWSKQEVADWLDCLEWSILRHNSEGLTVHEVCKKVRVSKARVLKVLKEHGRKELQPKPKKCGGFGLFLNVSSKLGAN